MGKIDIFYLNCNDYNIMTTPINIPINLQLLMSLIDEIDNITDSRFPIEEILEDIYDFIINHTHIYEFKYDGDDKDIKNILTELNDIKTIIDSNMTDRFKYDTICILPIYRSYL